MTNINTDRYAASPIKRFLDLYVLDVIGALPPEQDALLQRLDLRRILNTRESEWRLVLREALDFSDTFDTAILDLWLRWNDAGIAEGREYSAAEFAAGFTDYYLAEGSKIDVWPDGALQEARARISARRPQH